ncbi:MAG: hypothetical protein IH950_14730 [Bacteroidetes bacterium]|nr:hypothetical protein [Bacteroidota bacterium]
MECCTEGTHLEEDCAEGTPLEENGNISLFDKRVLPIAIPLFVPQGGMSQAPFGL